MGADFTGLNVSCIVAVHACVRVKSEREPVYSLRGCRTVKCSGTTILDNSQQNRANLNIKMNYA